MHEDDRGLRGLAVRAGLLYPRGFRYGLLPQYASPSVPCLDSSGRPPDSKKQQIRSLRGLFSEILPLEDAGYQMSGTHSLGLGTVFEVFLQGSRIQLDELRFTMSKSLLSQCSRSRRLPFESAKAALSLATDLQYRNRASLESTVGTKEDIHTVSCVVSSDFQTSLALGIASSHRLGKSWTFFNRFSRDDYAGERFIVQAVHELNSRSKLSAVCAATIGHLPQAGFSWMHEDCEKGNTERLVSLKALYGGDGSYSISIKAKIGCIG